MSSALTVVSESARHTESFFIQPSLRPHPRLEWRGNFSNTEATRVDDTSDAKSTRHRYASELTTWISPVNRLVVEYVQDARRETIAGKNNRKTEYLPLLWWESQRSRQLTTRLQLSYRKYSENAADGTELTPSFSLRYYLRSERRGLKSLYISSRLSAVFGKIQTAGARSHPGNRGASATPIRQYSNTLLIEWKSRSCERSEANCHFVWRINLSVNYQQNSQTADSFSLGFVSRASAVF